MIEPDDYATICAIASAYSQGVTDASEAVNALRTQCLSSGESAGHVVRVPAASDTQFSDDVRTGSDHCRRAYLTAYRNTVGASMEAVGEVARAQADGMDQLFHGEAITFPVSPTRE